MDIAVNGAAINGWLERKVHHPLYARNAKAHIGIKKERVEMFK